MNPIQLVQMMKSGGNPQAFVMNMLQQQSGNNPVMGNLLNLAKQGKTDEIVNVARNVLKEQGKDFDKEFADFRQKYNL